MTGCADYSYSKMTPTEQTQALPTSETDSRMHMRSIMQDVIASTNGVTSPLMVYQEDSVKLTKTDKTSLLEGIDTAIASVEKNVTYLENFRPATVLEEKKESMITLLNAFKGNLNSIREAVENDDFTQMATLTQAYDNLISQLQTMSL